MKTLLTDIDELLARLEDFTHGKDGKDITKMRKRISLEKKINTSDDVIDDVVKELKENVESNDNPGQYLDDEYYISCKAKSEAFEDAIFIVKKHSNKKIK